MDILAAGTKGQKNGLFEPAGDIYPTGSFERNKMTTIFYHKNECRGQINESEVEMVNLVRNFSIFLDLVNCCTLFALRTSAVCSSYILPTDHTLQTTSNPLPPPPSIVSNPLMQSN